MSALLCALVAFSMAVITVLAVVEGDSILAAIGGFGFGAWLANLVDAL